MDAALEFEGLFGADLGAGFGILVTLGIGDIDELVVGNFCSGAFIVAEEWAGLADAFDQVVLDAEGRKITFLIEAEEAFGARGGGGIGDDVIIPDGEIVVGFVDPDDTASRILYEVVVEAGGAFGGCFAKARDQVAVVLVGGEVEEVVADFNSVANELDRVGVAHEVVVDVEGFPAFGHWAAGVLGDGESAVADVMIDLVVLVVFEGKFHREVDLDGVVVKAGPFGLADLDAVKFVFLVHLGSPEAIVRNFGVLHPDGKDRASGDPAFDSGNAPAFPAATGIDEFAIVNTDFLHGEGSDSAPEDVLDADMVNMEIGVSKTINCSVKLRTGQSEIGNSDPIRLVVEAEKVGPGVHPLGFHLGVGEGFDGWLPIWDMGDDGLVHPDTFKGHTGFKIEWSGDLECARAQFNGVVFFAGYDRFDEGFARRQRSCEGLNAEKEREKKFHDFLITGRARKIFLFQKKIPRSDLPFKRLIGTGKWLKQVGCTTHRLVTLLIVFLLESFQKKYVFLRKPTLPELW